MPVGIFTNDWISRSARILYQGTSPPDKDSFYVALSTSNILTRDSTIAEFISSELLPENGYQRVNVNFGVDGIYNSVENRFELPAINPSFTASGASLQFQSAFLIADGKPFSSLELSPVNISSGENLITFTAHPFVDGDKVVFSADETSSLPSGINSLQVYTVSEATPDSFKIDSTIAGNGSGTFYIRSANGNIVAATIEDSPITVFDGQQYTYQIPIKSLSF